MRRTAILTIEIDFDPRVTDADAVGVAVDNLLETAQSTPGILEEYGEPGIGQTYIQHPRVPLLHKFYSDDDGELDTRAFLRAVADRINDDLDSNPLRAEAVEMFDAITAASYYGGDFKQILMEDRKAGDAARLLAKRLKLCGAIGLSRKDGGK